MLLRRGFASLPVLALNKASYDAGRACADTMKWFRGEQALATDGVALRGTWGELWSQDQASRGVIQTHAECAAAVDALSR